MFSRNTTNAFVLVLATVVVLGGGCIKVEQPKGRPVSIQKEELDQVLAVVIDLSGSFEGNWGGKAYPFFQEVIRRYFHSSMGSENRMLIGQLSGNGDPVFWSGTPRDFQRAFPNETAFLDRLAAEEKIGSSPVFRSIIAAIEHVEGIPQVGPNTKLTTIVLSDLEDNVADRAVQKRDAQRLLDVVKRYTDDGGSLALFYVAESKRPRWLRAFKKAGIEEDRYWIETDDVEKPTIPDFY